MGLRSLREFFQEVRKTRPLISSALDGEDRWEGPDDLWPPDEIPTETPTGADLIVTQQYGLRMPNGDVIWNTWDEPPLVILFDNHLDRLRMVANLQKTAVDLGFDVDEFLSHYGWVTRNQIAAVVYEDTGAYSLTDPDVCGVGTPLAGTDDGSSSSTSPTQSTEGSADSEAHDLNGTVRPRPVGGAAQ